MTVCNVTLLKKKAAKVRLKILQTALNAGKGHVPPAFSWTDIAVSLFYGGILSLDPSDPEWKDRDRFILSKGHACLTLYVILADLGYYPVEELDSFAGHGTLLPGHPDTLIPGVDAISGSLGHGLSTAAGLAMGARLNHEPWRTFIVMGDGECHEGSVWEAAMLAGHHKLKNLVAIIDRNMLGATDFTENIVKIDPLEDKFLSFGWQCVSIDGHNYEEILSALDSNRLTNNDRPLAVIANTTKGKGVDFMEASPDWHHQLPKGEAVDVALSQLKSTLNTQTVTD